MAECPVPAALHSAYLATTYRVWLPSGPVDLRVGEGCPALEVHLAQSCCPSWVVITASNPASRRLDEQENLARLRSLGGLLQSLALPTLPAENLADDGLWPPEPGFCVAAPVMDRELAQALGRRLGQNAVLFGEAGGLPELLWCLPAEAD